MERKRCQRMSCIDCAFSRKITRSKLINSSVLSNLCVCVDSRLAVNRLSYGVWCARFDLFLFISFFYSLHGTFFGGGSLSCSVAFVMCVALRRGEFTSMSRHDMHVTYQWQAGINQSECAWIVLLVLVLIQISTFSSVSPDFVFFLWFCFISALATSPASIMRKIFRANTVTATTLARYCPKIYTYCFFHFVVALYFFASALVLHLAPPQPELT